MESTFSGIFHVLVLLLLSLVTLGLAVSYAVRPAAKKLGILKSMTFATLFSIVAAVAAGVGGTALHCAQLEPPGNAQELDSIFMRGLAEAMVPPVFGSVVLALTWLMASVGLRREE
jgi:hypothetical protein